MRYFSNQVAPITENVFLSSVGGVTQERSLNEHGITHVLNVSIELRDLKYPLDDLKVVRVPLKDIETQDMLPHLDYLVDHVDEVARAGGHIAVHCIAGVSRSATVCIAYLVKHHDMRLKDAYRKVYKAREIIRPNRGFWKNLVDFEERYRGETSVELCPFICGLEPSVNKRDIEIRLRCSWMSKLMFMWIIHTLLMLLQVVFG